jgi:hypothetical protein
MTRLGNRFFTEWHKSTLQSHYFKLILQAWQYLFRTPQTSFILWHENQKNVDKFEQMNWKVNG